jgi:hypothetical protein
VNKDTIAFCYFNDKEYTLFVVNEQIANVILKVLVEELEKLNSATSTGGQSGVKP